MDTLCFLPNTAHLAKAGMWEQNVVSLPVSYPNHWIMLFFGIHFHGEINELTFTRDLERLVIVASLYFYSSKQLNMMNGFPISSCLSCSNNGSTDPRIKCQQNTQSQNKALLGDQSSYQYLNLSEVETCFYQKFQNISVLGVEIFEMDLFCILQFSKHF